MSTAVARGAVQVLANVRIAERIPASIRTIACLIQYCEEKFNEEAVVLEIDQDTLQAQFFGTNGHILYVPKNEEALSPRDRPAKIFAWYVDKEGEEKIGRRL